MSSSPTYSPAPPPGERTAGDVDRPPRSETHLFLAEGHRCLPADNLPMLRTVPVPLEAQAAPRPHHELLHLVSGILVQDQVVSPGAIPPFHRLGFLHDLSDIADCYIGSI